MKVSINRDEWAPFYYLDRGGEVEVPDPVVLEYEEALVRMDAVQAKIERIYKEQT